MGRREISDDDLYDLIEADIELQGRAHISDPYPDDWSDEYLDSIETCTNCGAYHSEPTFRCKPCHEVKG